MGNKQSANISDPTIKSYTQHPYGIISQDQTNIPRRNSFTNGVSIESNGKKFVSSKSSLNESNEQQRTTLSNKHSVPNPKFPTNAKNGHIAKSNGKNGTISPVLVNGKEEISRPGTNDSGYFTGYMTDSDKSERARLRGSRTSLNEAVFACQPPQPMPFYGPMPPRPMGPMGPPLGHMGPPPMCCGPALPPPGMSMYPPPMESKKEKKWRKKQRKILSRHESLVSTLDAPYPPLMPFPMMHPHPHPHQHPHQHPHPHPCHPHPHPHPSQSQPGQFNPMTYRAQSMDNLHIAARTLPHHMQHHSGHLMGPPPRRFTSQTDLRFANNPPPFLELPALPSIDGGRYDKRGRKLKEAKKDGSIKGSLLGTKNRQSSAPSSRSGRGSRNDDSNTRFEEERVLKPVESEHILTNFKDNNHEICLRKTPPPDVIYETLKAARRSTLLTTADIEFEKKRETKENVMNISFEKPTAMIESTTFKNAAEESFVKHENEHVQQVTVTPEAKLVMERNAELMANAEKYETKHNHNYHTVDEVCKEESKETENDVQTATNVDQTKRAVNQHNPKDLSTHPTDSGVQTASSNNDKMNDEIKFQSKSSTYTTTSEHSSNDDGTIEAILNPILLRRKTKKPQEFEPLTAWRDINVAPESKRQPTVNIAEEYSVKENIVVKMVPVPPSKKESHAEPIYLEYDERLPEFKKRLIETGSFDFPEMEKFHHSSQHSGSKFAKDIDSQNDLLENHQSNIVVRDESKKQWRTTATDDSVGGSTLLINKKNMEGKGSLKRLKDSVAHMFGGSKSNEKLNSQEQGYLKSTSNQERSLTPTTAKIKAGDSSDIDFSWVHDLETRFRREREQFERELETRKQKTLQRNSSLAHSQVSDQFLRRQTTDIVSPIGGTDFGSYHHNRDVAHFNGNGFKSVPQLNGNNYSDDHDDLARIKRTESAVSQRYFGDTHENGIMHKVQSTASNNVRNKAALFESEAQRMQNELDLKHQQMCRQKRTFSNPYRSECINEEPIYIPKPDYDGEMILMAQQSAPTEERISRYLKNRERPTSRNNVKRDYSPGNDLNGPITNGIRNGYQMSPSLPYNEMQRDHNVLQVETNHHPHYRYQSQDSSESPRSPSQRRLNRFYPPPSQTNGYHKSNGNLNGNHSNVNFISEKKQIRSHSPVFHNNKHSPNGVINGAATFNNMHHTFTNGHQYYTNDCDSVETKNREFVQRMNEMAMLKQNVNGYSSRMNGYEKGIHSNGNGHDSNPFMSHYVSQPSSFVDRPNEQFVKRGMHNGHVSCSNERPVLRNLP